MLSSSSAPRFDPDASTACPPALARVLLCLVALLAAGATPVSGPPLAVAALVSLSLLPLIDLARRRRAAAVPARSVRVPVLELFARRPMGTQD